MAKITGGAVKVLVPALVTCGGDVGMLFGTAKAIKGKEGGELMEIVPKYLAPVATSSLAELEKQAMGGTITPLSVIRRYGLPEHFQAMHKEATSGMASVAGEITADVRAIAHTLLPIKNGVYTNEGRMITLKGLVPLGPQSGNLVAHLAGVFSSGCTKEEIETLLAEQAKDTEFLALVDKVGTIDYSGTKLQEVTRRAKRTLDL